MLCVGALKILLDSSNIRSDYFISHAKKAEFIQQEVFARLLMYNFTELITALAVIHRDGKRYTYQANFSVAMHICRLFIRSNTPSNPEIFIAKFYYPYTAREVRPSGSNC